MSTGRNAARIATAADADRVTTVISAAFQDDPVWSWAFPSAELRQAQFAIWWGFLVEAALPHGWVWVTEAAEAVAIWIPPGQPELSTDDEAHAMRLLADLLGDGAEAVRDALERFDAAHPRHQPHFYLSLLGTHPDHAGRGLGMSLLEDNLARIDATHTAAYLESSNPVNNARYERAGFVRRGEFSVVDGGPVVTTMWRDPR
jgi:GNAT superfamily N-acetyltransferase